MDRIEELKREVARITLEVESAHDRLGVAQRELCEANAEAQGVRIGSVVYTEQTEGFGAKKRLVRRRYRVTRIGYRGANNISLSGTTIRKDGTDGERHDIWQHWTLEP